MRGGGGKEEEAKPNFPLLLTTVFVWSLKLEVEEENCLRRWLGKSIPWPLDTLGIQVLRLKYLRRLANKQSYFDVEKFATEDAMLVGRLPCFMDGMKRGKESPFPPPQPFPTLRRSQT